MIISEKMSSAFKIIFVAIVFVGISSCGKSEMDRKDKVAAIVGQLSDPFLAITFVPQVLIDKSGAKDGALPFTYEAFASFFMSESKTGIDNKGQVEIIVENSGGMVPNAYAFIPLISADDFKTLVTKELAAKVQEKNGAYYFRKDADNYVVAWKDDLAIVSNIPISLDNLFSKGTNESKEAAIRLVNLLNEVSRNNINSEFRAFFDREGDMQLYANGSSAYSIIDGMRFISKKDKVEYKSLLEGTIIETALNFENGSIQLDNNFELSDALAEYFKILKSNSVDVDMLNYGLSQSPMTAISLNISTPQMINILKKRREVLETDDLEEGLAEMNLTLDDVEKMFNGQMVVIIDGMDSISKSYNNFEGEEINYVDYEPRTAIVIGLNDTERVEKLMMQISLVNGNGEENMNQIDGMYYHFDNDKMILVNSIDWLNKIKNEETKSIKNERLVSGGLSIYSNPQLNEELDLDLEELEMIQKDVVDLVVKVADKGAHLTIKFKDANKNALRIILERIVEAFENQEKSSNYDMESILNEELIEEIESDVEESMQELINSKEMKDLKKVIEEL